MIASAKLALFSNGYCYTLEGQGHDKGVGKLSLYSYDIIKSMPES